MMRSPTNDRDEQCVLIVDDQERNLRLVSTVLSMTGFSVMTAQNGEQAIECLKAKIPDLILLDVIMPGSDGIQVCRNIQKNPEWKSIPIIFLSAEDDKNLVVQALEGGGVDYVTKPFNKAELLTRVRAHLALKAARDQLKILAEDKDELLGILAHDMQNHLAGIRMSAELLKNRADSMPENCGVFIDNIAQSTESLLTFVKEFLANQSAERLAVNNMLLDFKELVSVVAHQLHPLAEGKQIRVEVKAPANPVLCYADHEALTRVLDNLGSNAIKFSSPNTTLTFQVESFAGAWVGVHVIDEGPGFTEVDLSKIFKRYARLTARPTGGEPSTGLGLSIVKKLVEAMRGNVAVQNRPEGGACFTVRLPKAHESSPTS